MATVLFQADIDEDLHSRVVSVRDRFAVTNVTLLTSALEREVARLEGTPSPFENPATAIPPRPAKRA